MTRIEPGDTSELTEALRLCGSERKKLELGGHFSKRAMGGRIAPADVLISTARMTRLVEYEPRDLTLSVEAGLGFRAVQDLLAENNQMLPLDPPQAEAATVGGVVAANCSGPRRRLYGSVRDMVIGMTFMTLEGSEVRSGGMVVKNVAGLDMAKLMIGSFGTLAAIARVNFRVFPRPPKEQTFLFSFPSIESALEARDAILRSVLQPAAIDLVNPAVASSVQPDLTAGYLLLVEAGGIEGVMARYERELKGIARTAAASEFLALEPERSDPLWRAIRDFPACPPILRISSTLTRLGEAIALAGDLPAVARAGNGVVYVHCADSLSQLVSQARAAGLYVVIESCSPEDKEALELWADPGPELEVMSRIKSTLDPHNLLNHGRLYNRL